MSTMGLRGQAQPRNRRCEQTGEAYRRWGVLSTKSSTSHAFVPRKFRFKGRLNEMKNEKRRKENFIMAKLPKICTNITENIIGKSARRDPKETAENTKDRKMKKLNHKRRKKYKKNSRRKSSEKMKNGTNVEKHRKYGKNMNKICFASNPASFARR